MKFLSAFNSDWLNPVLVKEVRQFFHNKFFFSLVGILLAVQLLLVFIFNLSFDSWKNGDSAGRIFVIIDTILMYLCVFLTSGWNAMQRFTAERASKELDFSNITLLTPLQIVGGKLASSLVIWLLIAALCLPFMAAAYFFRNITPWQIMMIFAAGILPMLVIIQGALFCGALGTKWAHAIFVYFCFQVMPLMIGVVIATLFGSQGKREIFWLLQGGELIMFMIIFAATTALITPVFANRIFVLRLFIVLLMIPVWGIIPFVNSFKNDVQMALCCFPIGIFAVLALLNCCDRDDPGGRVLARVPRNTVGRIWHYLLSSNRTGGVVLGIVLLVLTCAEMLFVSTRASKSLMMLAVGVGAFALLYSEIAVLLHRSVPQLPGALWLLLVFLFLGVVTMIAAFEPTIDACDVYISVFSLFNTKGTPVIMDYRFWIAPIGTLIVGIPFIVQMCLTFKKYRAPEISRK